MLQIPNYLCSIFICDENHTKIVQKGFFNPFVGVRITAKKTRLKLNKKNLLSSKFLDDGNVCEAKKESVFSFVVCLVGYT